MTLPALPLRPWLIAAWPGMGNVATIAASHLVQQLGLVEHLDLNARGHVDVTEVNIKEGLIEPISLPRGAFFRAEQRSTARELIVFLGETQPTSANYQYASELIDVALQMKVERVVTFASLASGLQIAENPRVWGVATDSQTLQELKLAEVKPVTEGQISGQNGLILGVAAAKGITGMCLLAEIPYFAVRIPNPKAARAALSVFSILCGIDINLEELNKQAFLIEKAVKEAMERAERQAAAQAEAESSASESESPTESASPEEVIERTNAPAELSQEAREKIASLFAEARKDLGNVASLKDELDRLGVFKLYEGQFLDLFKRAG